MKDIVLIMFLFSSLFLGSVLFIITHDTGEQYLIECVKEDSDHPVRCAMKKYSYDILGPE